MAEQNPNNNSINTFDGSINTDLSNFYKNPKTWTYARNAITNSISGDLGGLGSEPSNFLCLKAPYTIIGFIYLYEDTWAVFSTDDLDSEIGLFKQSTCTYNRLVNDRCLNFNRDNLVRGVSKKNADCTWSIYFADNHRNYDRVLNINKIPYKETCVKNSDGCFECTPILPLQLDCNQIRLNKPTTIPCVRVTKGASSGSLPNGSYIATIAYSINGQKVTDYYGLSNTQSLFDHSNLAGSIDILFSDLDKDYDEFELVVITIINQQTVAKRIGIYSTRQEKVTLDIIAADLPSVPIDFIPVRNPIAESSKSISEVGDYMLRISPKNKFDFNYQPLANNITVKWVSVEFPAEYYKNGGNKPSLLRDEVYTLAIEWIYDDGDISSAYHIPGTNINSSPAIPFPYDQNNAQVTSITVQPVGEGGIQIAEGTMSFWQSTERYPDDKPAVWGPLCGKFIRHHKMPDHTIHPNLVHFVNNSPNIGGPAIRVLGIKLENINRPLDNFGNPIMNIVGYRILRGSREGNKTIIAKGMINNMIDYDIKDGSGKRGLFPNYPYNSQGVFSRSVGGFVDPYLSTTQTSTHPLTGNLQGYTPLQATTYKHITFHSPETQFRRPFLSPDYIRTYTLAVGTATGKFDYPENHPKYKLITNALFIAATLGGLGIGLIKLNGTRKTKFISPSVNFLHAGSILASPWAITGASNGGSANPLGGQGSFDRLNPLSAGFTGAAAFASAAYGTGAISLNTANLSGQNSALGLTQTLLGSWATNPYWNALTGYASLNNAAQLVNGTNARTETEQDPGLLGNMPSVIITALAQGIPLMSSYMNEGYDTMIRFIKSANNARHAALQYKSHCFYDNYFNTNVPVVRNNPVAKAEYLGSGFQEFGNSYKINNQFRSKTVAIETAINMPPNPGDTTKFTIETYNNNNPGSPIDYEDPTDKITQSTAASYYSALKIYLGNQYGQIGSVKLVPVGCKQSVTILDGPQAPFNSDIIYAGDTYITRYAERNTMFFFYDWLYGQPDETEFDYLAYRMLPYPKYWVNSDNFDFADFFRSILPTISSSSSLQLPTSRRALDNQGFGMQIGGLFKHGFFLLKNSYFYLFNSGVRDFYVESEINTFQRDWEDDDAKRFYDNESYSNLNTLFRVPNIKNLDYYKYDYSLSVSKSFIEFISWNSMQPLNYDPFTFETCYVFHKNRLLYSLPQPLELLRDNWRIFLANNYKDFRAEVTAVKSLNRNGAVIFFDTDSPIQIQGVETLNSDAGTKLTIGDGELFSQPQQSTTNSDRPYEYASCQNEASIVNTPAGIYWVSQNQGKIFTMSGGLKEISMKDIKWWLAEHLPYKLIQDFPTFELKDNPITGIGCQAMYDNKNTLLYFTKKDYRVRRDLAPNTTLSYVGGKVFNVLIGENVVGQTILGNPTYFENCSWTISYDPKEGEWIGFHDWHPDLLMPGKETFLSTKGTQGWTHNELCSSYCNFYGIDYPFEVEIPIATPAQVNILKNIEYYLEVYKYHANCVDRYLSGKDNFDELIVYNTEQVSGVLKLNNTPANDPWAIAAYPIVNPNNIDILYSRIENKYRINQFWDITDDRGDYTTAQRVIFNTAADGYRRALNPINLNYNKDPFQRKLFRNYLNRVILSKKVCGDKKYILLLNIGKNNLSQR